MHLVHFALQCLYLGSQSLHLLGLLGESLGLCSDQGSNIFEFVLRNGGGDRGGLAGGRQDGRKL